MKNYLQGSARGVESSKTITLAVACKWRGKEKKQMLLGNHLFGGKGGGLELKICPCAQKNVPPGLKPPKHALSSCKSLVERVCDFIQNYNQANNSYIVVSICFLFSFTITSRFLVYYIRLLSEQSGKKNAGQMNPQGQVFNPPLIPTHNQIMWTPKLIQLFEKNDVKC